MPMLTTSVNLPPSVAAILPERTPSAKAAIRSSTPSTSGITSLPSTRIGLPERLRSATCSTGRFSVVLIFAPVNIRSRRSTTPRSSASWISSVSACASMAVLEKSSSMSPSDTENSRNLSGLRSKSAVIRVPFAASPASVSSRQIALIAQPP